ncbi:uncharacterized protein PAC_09126 [Phialocephala subalpina]|uniref:Uncharacterized protein n=1 Tax=Phialocephala subalpina TaxID=576137 RepID=A0A1L7X2I3_9HELO|nr:uncharacterized protein PAC_09126 [Phialocephala subalpina]
MTSSFTVFCLIACLFTSVWGLQVTPNSACARICMDDPTADVSDPNVSNTLGQDIVCNDADYSSTSVGRKFKQCLTCLQNSTASSGSENDQGWFFYNLRYAFNTCIYAATNASDPISTPCSTNTVCAPLQSALQTGMQDPSTMGGQYSYCTSNNNAFVGSNLGICQSCLRENSDVFYLSNFLVALDAGCLQQPNTTVVGLNSTLFTNTQVAIVVPAISQVPKNHKPLSEGGIIGIAVGGAVVIIILIAIGFICHKKRRNARRLKLLQSPLDERFGASEISAPNKGAFSSPQISPSTHKDSINLKEAPKVRNFSFSRPTPPQRAGEWTGESPGRTSTVFSSSPPGYDVSPASSPPNSGRSSIPTHHAYIPPEYTPPSRNSTSPLYVPPPAPSPPQQPPHGMPASYPQRSQSALGVRTTGSAPNNTSPNYVHRSLPSTSSIRTRSNAPPPVSVARNPSTTSRLTINRAHTPHHSISPSLINTIPNPSANVNLNGTNGNGEENHISGPMIRVGNRFENEDEARRARERLYREGLAGRTLVHGPEEEVAERRSPESESGSEELWPGSY